MTGIVKSCVPTSEHWRGNQECAAGGNAVVASARLVVGKVNPLLGAYAAFTSSRQFADNLQTTNGLSRRGLE
jgi:hypothetical protein